jgi:hypothetical protein
MTHHSTVAETVGVACLDMLCHAHRVDDTLAPENRALSLAMAGSGAKDSEHNTLATNHAGSTVKLRCVGTVYVLKVTVRT